MTKVAVIGAGMAGLLAGNMLGSDLDCIIEKQEQLPNNHSAVLRFRTSHVGDVLNIPFKKVRMIKDTIPWRNPVADALSYSYKTTGTSLIRSSVSARGEIVERYIAPENLVERMFYKIGDAKFLFGALENSWPNNPTISTIPMPELMNILGYKTKDNWFVYRKGANVSFLVADCDAYASVYLTDPSLPISRISLMGDVCIAECYDGLLPPSQEIAAIALHFLGLDNRMISVPEVREQKYAKILPMDEDERKRFIIFASENYNIYSFGRFATWRPGLLMDDLVNDFRVIMKLINGGTKYDHVKRG